MMLTFVGALAIAALVAARTFAADHLIGLPAQTVVDSAATIQLGQQLFFDRRLSGDGTISCASCHQPTKAFASDAAKAIGIAQHKGVRNAPSLLNVGFNRAILWDGRKATLEEQSLEPLTNPLEHGLADTATLIKTLQASDAYVQAFSKAFNRTERIPIRLQEVARALAAYQRSLNAAGSAFDRYYYAGQTNALAPAARRGLNLFNGAAKCSACHIIGAQYSLFTDEKYHSIGVAMLPISDKLASLTRRVVQLRQSGQPLNHKILGISEISSLGRFNVTLNPADIGKFRTPSLRNVALTAPYMHDGSVETLQQAVELELYYRGDTDGKPLVLTPAEQADLVAFLVSLTSPAALNYPDLHAKSSK
jgi:cytochrome c peroxidase